MGRAGKERLQDVCDGSGAAVTQATREALRGPVRITDHVRFSPALQGDLKCSSQVQLWQCEKNGDENVNDNTNPK